MVEAAIDPVTDKKFAIFSDEDRQFLARFFAAHPQVGENFDAFLSTPPPLQFSLAKVKLWEIERAGWVRRGIKDPETVMWHSIMLPKMIEDYFAVIHRHPDFVFDESTRAFEYKVIKMAAFHDFHEVITTDFTPHHKIPPEDKARIESLAARVVFAMPEAQTTLQWVEEYIRQDSPSSQFVHDFDKIHAVRAALFYESKYPEQVDLFKEFYDYALPRMKTDAGRNYLLGLDAHKAEWLAELQRKHLSRTASSLSRG